MSTLQDRIAEIMRTTGMSVRDLAMIAGVSSSAVSQWKDGPTKSLKTRPATKLEEMTGYSARWIADGEGEKYAGQVAEDRLLELLHASGIQAHRITGAQKDMVPTWLQDASEQGTCYLPDLAVQRRDGGWLFIDIRPQFRDRRGELLAQLMEEHPSDFLVTTPADISSGTIMGRLAEHISEIQPIVGGGNVPGVRVPLLSNSASMGPGADIEHDDIILGTLTLSPEWLTRRIRPSSEDALRFIHAYGDSMSPTLEDGDVALVDTGRIDPSGADGVYVLATNERIFIKRVTERFAGGHDVTSDNPTVKTVQELNGGNSIRVLGKVVWVWNGRKL